MFSKANKKERIDPEQREQYDYARTRIKQKKRLMRHFILFLAGSILLIIINPVLGIGKEFYIENWFVWAILLWALFFLVHLLNVFVMNRFMGKEWEDRQLEKLKAKQEKRIAELTKKVTKEVTVAAIKEERSESETSLDEAQIKKNDLLDQLPPEEA